MAKEFTLFTYTSTTDKPPPHRSHIIVHPDRFKWLVINNEALEIAKYLAEGDPPELIAERLATKYGISSEVALRDVNYVEEELKKNLFLGRVSI